MKRAEPRPTLLFVGEDGTPEAVAIAVQAWRDDVERRPGTALVRYEPAVSAHERTALRFMRHELRRWLRSGVKMDSVAIRDTLRVAARKMRGQR